MSSTRRAALAAVLAATACSSLPEIPANRCGNHVLDEGEDCDVDGPACGAPQSPAACRFTCAVSTPCPEGAACGHDGICRRPTGTYLVSPPVGEEGDRFEALDVDGDGTVELVGRSSTEVRLYHASLDGTFTTLARGAVEAQLSLAQPIAVGRFPRDAQPVVAAVAHEGLDLYTLAGASLDTLVYPQVLFPGTGGSSVFVGGVRFGAGEGAFAAWYDVNGRLDAWSLAAPGAKSRSLDVKGCPFAFSQGSQQLAVDVAPLDGGGSLLAWWGGGTSACVVRADTHGFVSVAALPPLVLPLDSSIEEIRLGDVDGDGLLDVISIDFDASSAWHLVLWRQRRDGSFASPDVYALRAPPFGGSIRNLLAADLDGDGRVDFGYDLGTPLSTVLLNRLGTSGLESHALLDTLIPSPDYATPSLGADLDRDGHADVAIGTYLYGAISTCLGDGSGLRFTCEDLDTGLSSVSSIVAGDFNGDGTRDVLAAGYTRAGLAASSFDTGLSLVLGRPFTFPAVTPGLARVYRASPVGFVSSPSTHRIGDDAAVILIADDGTRGAALGHASNGGRLAFTLPGSFSDVQWRAPRSAVEQPSLYAIDVAHRGVLVLAGQAGGGFARAPLELPIVSSLMQPYARLLALPTAPAPAVFWDSYDGTWVGTLDGGRYTMARLDMPEATDSMSSFYTLPASLGGDGVPELLTMVSTVADRVFYRTRFESSAAPRVDRVLGFTSDRFSDLAFAARSGGALTGPEDVFIVEDDLVVTQFPVAAGGRWDAQPPIRNPRIFRQSPGGALGKLDQQGLWITTRDVNGDGIDDVVLDTGSGARVLFAEVVRR